MPRTVRILFRKLETLEIMVDPNPDKVKGAVSAMKQAGWLPQYIDDKRVVGVCDVCRGPILDGDAHEFTIQGDATKTRCGSCQAKETA